MPFQINFI